MNCFFCKAEMEEGFTTHLAELKNCILVIKNVPCLKCSQCGNVSFTGDVALKIESIIEKYEDAFAEIAVVNYTDHAA